MQIIHSLIQKYQKLNSKIIQSIGFLGGFVRPLSKIGLPLMKNVPVLLGKRVLIPLVLTAEKSVADAGMHKRMLGTEIHPLDLAQQRALKIVN